MTKQQDMTQDQTRKKREFAMKFSALDESWRMRKDLAEVIIIKDKEGHSVEQIKPLSFTAIMARKYAFIYIFSIYFTEKGEKAWRNKILKLLGWNGEGSSRHRYQMILYRQLRDLKRDFNFEVRAISAKSLNKEENGLRYYEVSNYGVFDKDALNEMFEANKEVFNTILEFIPSILTSR